MKIEIQEHQNDMQIIIQCRQINEQVLHLKSHIELFDNKLQAKMEDKIYFVQSKDVLYFESVDNRIFLYTENNVMEIKQRLYELELILPKEDFIRISKSQIVNINKIRALKPEINRTILVTMCNGEQLYVSRKYVKIFRSMLSL